MHFQNETVKVYPSEKVKEKLEVRTSKLMTKGKGILCADETLPAFTVMFNAIFLQNNEENRRIYRELMFSTKDMSQFISGVLLSGEAVSQICVKGAPFPELLGENEISPGVTIDKGITRIPMLEDEWVTQGLDDLEDRCGRYKLSGCVFTNWRCVFNVDHSRPSRHAIEANAQALARYANVVQREKMVPMIEIELLTYNGYFTLERSQAALESVLSCVLKALTDYNIYLEGIVLRISMVLPGELCGTSYTDQQIAEATLMALLRTVPPAVGGVTFLSGDQRAVEATRHLSAIMKYQCRKPWPITYSFSRPLQAPVLISWLGENSLVNKAQKVLFENAKEISEAVLGEQS